MCGRLRTWLTLSLALHLAVLAFAAPGRRLPAPAGDPAARWDAMTVDLPAGRATPPAAARAVSPAPAMPPFKEEPVAAEDVPRDAPVPPPRETERPDAAGGRMEGKTVPATIVRNEDFDRMAYIREMSVKTMSYYRIASKGFEGVLRSALPPEALREDGNATVSIGLSASGGPGDVDIRSDSPALLSALRQVRWETSPLPSRYRIPCRKVELRVSVAGERLAVEVKFM
ncbi:MAG: hypothetical protein H6Q84_2267 [Deltaproteobacteria bacterium]|nr:hypothetical protein [Deltaproteobacteria bacterium]